MATTPHDSTHDSAELTTWLAAFDAWEIASVQLREDRSPVDAEAQKQLREARRLLLMAKGMMKP